MFVSVLVFVSVFVFVCVFMNADICGILLNEFAKSRGGRWPLLLFLSISYLPVRSLSR